MPIIHGGIPIITGNIPIIHGEIFIIPGDIPIICTNSISNLLRYKSSAKSETCELRMFCQLGDKETCAVRLETSEVSCQFGDEQA